VIQLAHGLRVWINEEEIMKHMRPSPTGVFLSIVCAVAAFSQPAFAQNWTVDARIIALGGEGGSQSLDTKMIDEQRDYRAIVLPIGLIQVFSDFGKFDPGSSDFNPVRALEDASSPFYYVVGRESTNTGTAFVTDIRNATLSRDLNNYRGFAPANNLLTEGLAAPSWGGTIKLHKDARGGFQGIYIGAGPYFTMQTATTIDPGLTSLLASATPVTVPNAQFPITSTSQGQIAIAVTGGYRGRFGWPAGAGSGSDRNGLYVAANYDYLHGLRYEDIGLNIQLDTDNTGLITLAPATSPVVINRRTATSGQGFALDLGVGAVINGLEVGFGANGIANRITWNNMEQTTYSLGSLLSGNGNFIQTPPATVADSRVELPVDYRGSVAYNADRWSVRAEGGQGFEGGSFHGGFEQRFDRIALRAGARYTLKQWNPTGGIGLDFSRHVSLDVAVFGTSANIELKHQVAVAASIRLNRIK
jgi:hypothetical protein